MVMGSTGSIEVYRGRLRSQLTFKSFGPMTFEVDGGAPISSRWVSLPVKVRLEALATWTRMAGRATLTVEEAMEEARREASTRVEAIVTDGGELWKKEDNSRWKGRLGRIAEDYKSASWLGVDEGKNEKGREKDRAEVR